MSTPLHLHHPPPPTASTTIDPSSVVFLADGMGNLDAVDARTPRLLHAASRLHSSSMHCVEFISDSRLVTTSYDNTAKIVRFSLLPTEDGTMIEIPEEEILKEQGGHTAGCRNCAFMPRGRLLVTGGYDHLICVWRPRCLSDADESSEDDDDDEMESSSGALVGRINHHEKEVFYLIQNESSNWFASASRDESWCLWDIEKSLVNGVSSSSSSSEEQTPLRSFHVPGARTVYALGFDVSRSPFLVSSVGDDARLRLWDLRVQNSKGGLVGEADSGDSVSFYAVVHAPGNREILVGRNDGTVAVFDERKLVKSEGGEAMVVQKLKVHESRIWRIRAFCPEERLYVSCGEDDTARLWKLGGEQEEPTDTPSFKIIHRAKSDLVGLCTMAVDLEKVYLQLGGMWGGRKDGPLSDEQQQRCEFLARMLEEEEEEEEEEGESSSTTTNRISVSVLDAAGSSVQVLRSVLMIPNEVRKVMLESPTSHHTFSSEFSTEELLKVLLGFVDLPKKKPLLLLDFFTVFWAVNAKWWAQLVCERVASLDSRNSIRVLREMSLKGCEITAANPLCHAAFCALKQEEEEGIRDLLEDEKDSLILSALADFSPSPIPSHSAFLGVESSRPNRTDFQEDPIKKRPVTSRVASQLVRAELLQTKEFSNLILRATDSTERPAHREILIAGSNFFHRMLTYAGQEADEVRQRAVVELQYLAGAELDVLLEILYLGKIGDTTTASTNHDCDDLARALNHCVMYNEEQAIRALFETFVALFRASSSSNVDEKKALLERLDSLIENPETKRDLVAHLRLFGGLSV